VLAPVVAACSRDDERERPPLRIELARERVPEDWDDDGPDAAAAAAVVIVAVAGGRVG
jgi:hypothetical protein